MAEHKFSLPLRKDLPIWPHFVEITERRNLFVHNDGQISSQYLKICKEHKAELEPDSRLGKQLSVSQQYFKMAYECIFEIGTKLTPVLWRKVSPSNLKAADENLNAICFELIAEENFGLAVNLLDFATCTLKKHDNEHMRRVFTINRAQAYKWFGQKEKAATILSGEDWSASSDLLKLCVATLEDRYDTVVGLMRQIGPTETQRANYKSWPIFRELRATDQFLDTYLELFGEPFTLNQTTEKPETAASIHEGELGTTFESNGQTSVNAAESQLPPASKT